MATADSLKQKRSGMMEPNPMMGPGGGMPPMGGPMAAPEGSLPPMDAPPL